VAKSRSKMTRGKGRQVHPQGGVVTITDDERARLKAKRLEIGWRQEDLSTRAGVSPATVSNLESGRSDQIKRVVYSKIIRALKLGDLPAPSTDESFKRIVEGAVDLDEQASRLVAEMIDTLSKKPRST
jgi:transcriptional regulator with XRE-family HTH domain